MISFRNEIAQDCDAIAHLHALSWQRHYAGIFDGKYLENEVFSDRLQVWKKRFLAIEPDRHIVLAEYDGKLTGFACTYLNHHPEWGALLDNLHVLRQYQGRGIGLKLMQMSYQWVKSKDAEQSMYLGVLVDNLPAKNFYLNVGGIPVNQFSEICPAGNRVTVDQLKWESLPNFGSKSAVK